MKIVAVHNFYQQAGGEDQVFASETHMLENRGYSVLRWTEDNDRVAEMSKLDLAVSTVWNRRAYRDLYALVRKERPEIVHFHNTFPLLSPSCYYAARSAGAAVVQTLHNFRLICPAATLLREGRPCEDCVGATVPWHGLQHSCYRGSRTASAGVVAMLTVHNLAGTWSKAVDAYIALTEFSKSRFVAGGLPASRIFVKPNFAEPDPGLGTGGNYFLFAGRLSPEKGLKVLIDAWRLAPRMPPLKIIGDGPEGAWLQDQIGTLTNVEWLRRLPRDEVLGFMKNARALILPSIWYENFPVTIVEAYATGLPVIASDAGGLTELVRDGVTGFTFRSGEASELKDRVVQIETSAELWGSLRLAARREFENSYREHQNFLLLTDLYRKAIEHRKLFR